MLWCCDVVMLWCCDVVMLWCCDVVTCDNDVVMLTVVKVWRLFVSAIFHSDTTQHTYDISTYRLFTLERSSISPPPATTRTQHVLLLWPGDNDVVMLWRCDNDVVMLWRLWRFDICSFRLSSTQTPLNTPTTFRRTLHLIVDLATTCHHAHSSTDKSLRRSYSAAALKIIWDTYLSSLLSVFFAAWWYY